MELLAALVTVLWAQAPPPPVAPARDALPIELGWDAPAGCPGVEAVRAGIAHELPPLSEAIAPLHADVAVHALDAEHWQAALALRGGDWTATRLLKGASCAAVADAAGLVIGLALTSELRAREVGVAPPPAPAPRPLSTPAVGLAVGGAAGTSLSAAPGGALSVGWRFAHARADLRASLFASRAANVAGFPETGGRLSLASLAADGCVLWGRAVSLGPCVVAGVDRVHGTGTGPIAAGEVTNFAPFLGGGLRGEWRLSRWVAPFVDVQAAIPLVRARFSVENVGLVHEAAAVSFRGAAGLELRFR